jgi:MoaA/NifB/PqqE/SkfB family radical SAM enzyme
MRSDRVFTNLVCNQGCGYCASRAPSDDPRAIAGARIRAAVDAALAGGARELVLTGGEPTMRRDLAALVRHARERGAERVVLETNGTLLDEARARELAAAGLSLARVNLAGFGDALDAVTRDPGGFQRTLAGLRALAGAGVPFEIAAAVVRSTAPLLPSLPGELARALGDHRPAAIVLAVPTESPEPGELLAYGEATEVIARVDNAARAVGVRLRLAPDHRPPPCAFPHQSRVAHLFALTPGAGARADLVRVDACATCVVVDRCGGFSRAYLDRWPPPAVRPVTEDRIRRRLSLASSVDDQIRRELVTFCQQRADADHVVDEHVIRVNFHCNQACEFCFVSTHLPPAGDAAVREAILAAGRAGARVVLSGGEPALNPSLVDYVRLARAQGPLPVEIQTNATLLDDLALTRALVDAGLGDAFVSLHAVTAAISDAITEAPGTFARTLIGVDNLVACGVRVRLNFVICQLNHVELVPYVRMVAGRWPTASVTLSFVAPSTDVVPRTPRLIPRYTEVMPYVAEALAEAERLGVTVLGFESMCGIPLCLVPSGAEKFSDLGMIPEGFDGGEFVKADACRSCALEGRCHGIRRRYTELYGVSELRPVATAS